MDNEEATFLSIQQLSYEALNKRWWWWWLNSVYTDMYYADDCPPYMFRCGMGLCLRDAVYCNGTVECPDGSDEPPNCQSELCWFLCLRQSRLRGGIMLSVDLSIRPSVTNIVYMIMLNTNEPILLQLCTNSYAARDETITFVGQEVKGQGHRTPKLDLATWWRHHSRLLRSNTLSSWHIFCTAFWGTFLNDHWSPAVRTNFCFIHLILFLAVNLSVLR